MRSTRSPLSAALFVAVGVLGGCRPSLGEDCTNHRCITIEGNDGTSPLAAMDDRRAAGNGQMVDSCRIIVRRQNTSAAVGFESATTAAKDDVTIVDGALIKVLRCTGDGIQAHAMLLLNPDAYSWAVPAQGDLFLPFDINEVTTLSDDSFAAARRENDEHGVPKEGRFCVLVGRHGMDEDFRCGVHNGDTFTWGSHRAEIVRILPPSLEISGWMEVALK